MFGIYVAVYQTSYPESPGKNVCVKLNYVIVRSFISNALRLLPALRIPGRCNFGLPHNQAPL